MAETAYNFNSDFLHYEGRGVSTRLFQHVIDDIFENITSGEDMPLSVRQVIARIPNLNDVNTRWRFWDGIDDDLLEADGNDLNAEDMEALKEATRVFFINLEAPEDIETAAHLFMLSVAGEDFTIPDGSSAVEQLPLVALKSRLSAITQTEGGARTPAIGDGFGTYNIDPDTALDPNSEEFIETFGAALALIQEDMRTIGKAPPTETNEKFYDPQGLVDAKTTRDLIIDKFIDDLEGEEIDAIKALSGDERYDALASYISGMDDAFPPKNYYMDVINTLSPDASGHDLVQLALDYGVADETAQMRTTLHSLHMVGEDRSGMIGDQMRFHLDAYLEHVPSATLGTPEMQRRAFAFDEIYTLYQALPEEQRAAIDATLEANAGESPGVELPPTPEEREQRRAEAEKEGAMEPEDKSRLELLQSTAEAMGIPPHIVNNMESVRRIEGVTYAHFDEGFERNMREIFEDNWETMYGRKVPGADDPSERTGGDENLWRMRFPENGVAYEYQIDPQTGDIDKYRVGADGGLYTTVSAEDNTPIMLDGNHADFNIFHPNRVSQVLLERLAAKEWEQLIEDGIFENTAPPSAEEIDEAFDKIEQEIKEGIRVLQPDIEDEELESIYQDITQNDYSFEQLKTKLKAAEASESVALQVNSLIIQMNALNNYSPLLAMRDYANFTVGGLLPGGINVGRPHMDAPWERNFDNAFARGELQPERITEFRILSGEAYASLNTTGTTETAHFEGNDYAMSYINAQGWEGTLDTTQTGMIVRALMIKDAADLHGIENPDPNSPEARAAFLKEIQTDLFNPHDVELMMLSFDSNAANRAEFRAEHDSVAYNPGDFDNAADARHRAALFNEMFKQPVELTNADGSTRVVESTISRDDAVRMFWRDYTEHRELGYDQSLYGLTYEDMVEKHGDEFVDRIEGIMTNSSEIQRKGLGDANNPIGDFRNETVRRYLSRVQERAELEYKAQNDVISAPESTISEATLDPEVDTITTIPENNAEEAPDTAVNDNAEELRAMCDELTMPSAALATQCGIDPSRTIQPTAPGTL